MVRVADTTVDLLEEPPVARRSDKPKRERARDRGEVIALGIEVSAAHAQAVDDLCAKLRWTKRVALEAAIEALAAKHDIHIVADAE